MHESRNFLLMDGSSPIIDRKAKYEDTTAGQGINKCDGGNSHSSLLVASIFPLEKRIH